VHVSHADVKNKQIEKKNTETQLLKKKYVVDEVQLSSLPLFQSTPYSLNHKGSIPMRVE
jgi:hypothetical protein